MIALGKFKKSKITTKDFNLKGFVKSIVEEKILVDKNKNIITSSKDRIESRILKTYKFSNVGNILNIDKTTTVLEDNNTNNYKSSQSYVYDNLDRIIKYYEYENSYLEFIYNNKNLISEVNNKDFINGNWETNIKYEFSYDNNDRLTSIIRDDYKLNKGGKMYYKEVFSYSNDHLIREETFKQNGALNSFTLYEYSNNNISKSIMNTAFNMKIIKTFEYNINNDVILENAITTEYEYDNKNNWVKKIDFLKLNILGKIINFKNKIPISVTTRNITYYQ